MTQLTRDTLPSLTNRTHVRQFILAQVREYRKHTGLTRVSSEALDFYEQWTRQAILRQVDQAAQTLRTPHDRIPDRLLVASNVRRLLLGLYREHLPWLTIVKIDNQAIQAIEQGLCDRIHADVLAHPTVGKTFKP